MDAARPSLYSDRRCPYAMRARMALRYSGIAVEIREIALKDKPEHMLRLSPKGTVPVLALTEGQVIDQSLDIVHWALQRNDPENWRLIGAEAAQQEATALIDENDGSFKSALDRYKYAVRFPEQPMHVYRAEGERFLQRLEQRLQRQSHLCASQRSLADIAIFPFIRQFSMVDIAWFEQIGYTALRAWLQGLTGSQLFAGIMEKHPLWVEPTPLEDGT